MNCLATRSDYLQHLINFLFIACNRWVNQNNTASPKIYPWFNFQWNPNLANYRSLKSIYAKWWINLVERSEGLCYMLSHFTITEEKKNEWDTLPRFQCSLSSNSTVAYSYTCCLSELIKSPAHYLNSYQDHCGIVRLVPRQLGKFALFCHLRKNVQDMVGQFRKRQIFILGMFRVNVLKFQTVKSQFQTKQKA